MISDFFTTAFSIKRPTWKTDDDGNEYLEKDAAVSFSGHLQQAQAELAQNLGMSLTKTYSVWCAIDTDVKEGDLIETEDQAFTVRAKRDNLVGDNKHVELVVELNEVAPS